MLEIPVRAVNLYGIEPTDDCELAAIGEFLLFAVDLFYGHLPRHLPCHIVSCIFNNSIKIAQWLGDFSAAIS